MKKFLLLVAVGCLALTVMSTPAQAQYYARYPGTTVGVYTPNFGFQYSTQPTVVVPSYGYSGYGYSGYSNYPYSYAPRPHVDNYPGGFTPYGRYVPPHTDVHIGRRSYEVLPTPFGPQLSPVPHYHRH